MKSHLLLGLFVFTASNAIAAPLCKDVFKFTTPACGEHCVITKDFRLGSWGSSDSAYSTPAFNAKNSVIQIFKDYDRAADQRLRIVIIDSQRKMSVHTLPEASANWNLRAVYELGNQVAILTADKLIFFDPKTKKMTEKQTTAIEASINGLVWQSGKNQVSFYNEANGQIYSYPTPHEVSNIDNIVGGKHQHLIELENRTSLLIDFKLALEGGKNYRPLQISPPNNEMVMAAHDSALYVTRNWDDEVIRVYRSNAYNRPMAVIPSDGIAHAEFSADGKFLILNYFKKDRTRTAEMYEIENNTLKLKLSESAPIGKTVGIRWSPDQTKMLFVKESGLDNNFEGELRLHDLKTGKITKINLPEVAEKSGKTGLRLDSDSVIFMPDSESIYFSDNGLIVDFKESTVVNVAEVASSITARFGAATAVLPDGRKVFRVTDLGKIQAKPMSTVLSTGEQLKTLLKVNAPDRAAMIGPVREYFSSGAYKNDPQLTMELMLWMASDSPAVAARYLYAYPEMKVLFSQMELKTQGIIQTQLAVERGNRLANNLAKASTPIPMEMFPLLKHYFKNQTDRGVIRQQMVAIATKMVQNSPLRYQQPASSLDEGVQVNLTMQYLRRLSGQKYRHYTDISVEANSVIIYGTDAMDGAPLNQLGFAVKSADKLPDNAETFDKIYKWNFLGKEQSARVKISLIPIAQGELVPKKSARPDYAQFRKDGKLTGLIGISANLGGAFGRELGDQYVQYLQARGFKFKSQKFSDSNEGIAFISEKIKSGEIEYFLREGHGENRSEYILSVTPTLEIVTATNPKTNEVIYVVMPGENNSSLSAYNPGLTYTQFGKALRSRQNATDQFLYVEGKCWGLGINNTQMVKVAAKGFVAVGSDNMLTTFTNEQNANSIYYVLEGIRNGKDYTDMVGIEGDGKFVFPDSDIYFSKIKKDELAKARPTELTVERKLVLPEEK